MSRRHRRCGWLLTTLLLLGAVPADATVVDTAVEQAIAGDRPGALATLGSALEADPDNQDLRFAYARVLAWDGQYAQALSQFDRLLAADPDNADVLLGKAQVLVWSERPESALPLLARARSLAPDYLAVWQLEDRALTAAAGAQHRARHERLIEEARERFPDHEWSDWATTRMVVATRTELEAGAGWYDLGAGRDDWTLLYVDASHALGDERTVFARMSRWERFALTDTELLAGLTLPLGERWAASLQGSLTPAADVLPRRSLQLDARRELGRGMAASATLRQAGYANDTLRIYALGLERYQGNWYGAWRVSAGRLGAADTTWSQQLRIDRYYGDGHRAGLIVATGRETESLGDGQFITSGVRTAVLQGRHRIGPAWALSWEITLQRQVGAYTRRGLSVGLRHQF